MARYILMVLATLVLADSSPRAQTVEPAAPAVQAAPAEKPKLICRKEERPGSRVGARKVCKTAAEWAGSDLVGDKDAKEFFENKGTGNTEGPR